ncbi:unnamed protein product [Meganyctiphanes norvegica]|uniref:HORMA domain-containing protein n=1 Tax=Meganyctiphanes norvegica TaxID=48144 RepID=A0AAV2PRC8_MEGNR
MATGTAQKHRIIASQKEKQSVDMWSKVFTAEQKTMEQSLQFVKKLVNVGMSSITYLRAVLPESAYCDEAAEGLALKLLNENSKCRRSAVMLGWINGCFDALEKKYLRQLTLEFFCDDKNPEKAFETYTFSFKYTEDGEVQMDDVSGVAVSECNKFKNKFEVRRPTIKMLRTIILLTNSLQPMPEKAFMSLKLKYYDETTPEDYQPPGFQECDDENTAINDSIKIKIGHVTTPYHSVVLKCCTERKLFEIDGVDSISRMEYNNSEDSNKLENPSKAPTLHSGLISMTQVSQSNSQMHNDNYMHSGTIKPVSNLPEQCEEQIVPLPVTQYMAGYSTPKLEYSCTTTPMSQKSSSKMRTPGTIKSNTTPEMICPSQPDPDYPVRCPCQVNLDEGLMILCDICGFWQHAVCFLVIDENQAPDTHICERCSTDCNICTEPNLSGMTEGNVKVTCLYRRMLVMFEKCIQGTKVSSCTLAQSLGIDITQAVNLFYSATDDSILVILNKKEETYAIDRQRLLNWAFPKYLNYKHECKDSPVVNQLKNGDNTDSDATPELPFLSFRQSDIIETQDVPVATYTGKKYNNFTGFSRETDNNDTKIPDSNNDNLLSDNSQYMYSQNGKNHPLENLIHESSQLSNNATVDINTQTQDLLLTQLEQGNSEPFLVGSNEEALKSPLPMKLSQIKLQNSPKCRDIKYLDKSNGSRLSRGRKRLGENSESQASLKKEPEWEISDSQGSSLRSLRTRIQRRTKVSRTSKL